MELTVKGSLRGALDVLKGAEISMQDSDMYAPRSEMYNRYRESTAIRVDFARAHLRQARHLASRNFELTEIFSELRGESFGGRIDECLVLLTESPDAVEECSSEVEDLVDKITELVSNGYLTEEP